MAKLLVASEFIDSESKETTPVRNPLMHAPNR